MMTGDACMGGVAELSVAMLPQNGTYSITEALWAVSSFLVADVLFFRAARVSAA